MANIANACSALARAGLPPNFQSDEKVGLDVALTTLNSMAPAMYAELVKDLYGANVVLKNGVLANNPAFYGSAVLSSGSHKIKDERGHGVD